VADAPLLLYDLYDADDDRNWVLKCHYCERVFADDETIELMDNKHFKVEHGEDTVSVDVVWVGMGPTPKRGK
jgi:hypothetical protein